MIQSAILKPLRVVIALLFILSAVLLFSGLASLLPGQVVRYVTWLQFIPSLLKFTGVVSFSSAGFIIVIILTLLSGRVYCSFICPLGILQDLFIRSSAILRRQTNTYKRPLYIISLSVLVICVLPLFFQNIFFLNLLDPFGLSGKVFAGLRGTLVLSLCLLLFFMLLSMLKNRWYCNVICPAGIFLGLCSRVSFFRIRVDKELCKACGTCEGVCKSNCIDFKEHRLDFDRCVGCMNCLDSCPEKAIKYRFRWKTDIVAVAAKETAFDLSRRNFLITAAGGAATFAGLLAPSALFANPEPNPESYPVMPPGALSLWHFTQKCTACQLCISACPMHVLQTSFFEYGLSGVFQPKMDFTGSYCKFDCIKCSEICPTGAIQPLVVKEKQQIQIGLAVFLKNQCLVVEKQKPCAKCAEHCPTKAIELMPYLGDLKIPKVSSGLCNGCGACEFYCPVRPDRAIYVEANIYHRKLI